MAFVGWQQRYLHYHQVRCKYKYMAGEEILPPQQQMIIEEVRFSPLVKSFEKQTKMIEKKGEKEVKNLQSLNLTNK